MIAAQVRSTRGAPQMQSRIFRRKLMEESWLDGLDETPVFVRADEPADLDLEQIAREVEEAEYARLY